MTTTTPFVLPGEPLNTFLQSFWRRQVDAAEQETPDYRHPPLPLARIKKVMKSDPDVKMIAADAPILFCKACEIFIAEITARAFIVADSNKRRTLSRADIAKALSKSDQFDSSSISFRARRLLFRHPGPQGVRRRLGRRMSSRIRELRVKKDRWARWRWKTQRARRTVVARSWSRYVSWPSSQPPGFGSLPPFF
ncbi:histone-fold-containing protein, partial [Flammula alnicola]